MMGIVKTINGVKQLVPLTTDSGQGLPLGAITAFYGTTPPNGYLLCDGSEFSTTDYPALYTFLGDNHTPDLREVTLKGIGETSRTVGAHVKSGGLGVGEFIDDQLQNIEGSFGAYAYGNGGAVGAISGRVDNPNSIYGGQQTKNYNYAKFSFDASRVARTGSTTEVKAVGVNFIIKAVIGPIEDSAADQVVQNINNSRSYSTEEVNTGKTWIDGKPIYRIVTPSITKSFPYRTTTEVIKFSDYVSNFGELVSFQEKLETNGMYYFQTGQFGLGSNNNGDGLNAYQDFTGGISISKTYRFILEYTKTTS